jgi:type IV pilus assembly protein PilE
MNTRTQQGFTLIELMIVVAVLGILAAIAIPSYNDYVLRSRLTEGFAQLSGHRVKMEQFYQDNRTYTGACAAGTVATKPADSENFTYSCNIAGDGQSYTVTATGAAAAAGFGYSINQSGARTTDAVPSGWTVPSPNTCWARKKGGVC